MNKENDVSWWLELLSIATMIVMLLALRTKDLTAAIFRNAAGLVVYSRWQAVSQEVGFPTCQAGDGLTFAEKWVQYALSLASEKELVWLVHGRVAWMTDRCEQAVQDWEHALALSPQNSVIWFPYLVATQGQHMRPDPVIAQNIAGYVSGLGDRAVKTNRVQESLRWYTLSFDVYPNIYVARQLESLYLKSEQQVNAVAVWKELAASRLDDDADHWWALGRAAELSEEWERAAFLYGEGARRSKKPYDFWMRQGVALERLKKWAQAEDVYRRAVVARPDFFWPYLSVGNMRRVQGDYVGALIWCQKAEMLATDRYEPKYYVGLAHYLREEYPAAEASLRAALELNPQHAWSAYYLAQSLYRQGRKQEATEWLQGAIGLYPGQPWNWAVQLGDWLTESGDKEGALAAYRQALEWKPGDAGIQAKIQALEDVVEE